MVTETASEEAGSGKADLVVRLNEKTKGKSEKVGKASDGAIRTLATGAADTNTAKRKTARARRYRIFSVEIRV